MKRYAWFRTLMYRLGWVPVESFNEALAALQRKDRMLKQGQDDYEWLLRVLPPSSPALRTAVLRPHRPYGSTA